VFQNKVLRRIFGPTREEVAGGWRRLVARKGNFGRKTGRPLGRSRRRRKDNI